MWNGLEGRDYFGEKCSAITALKFQRKLIHIRTYRNWGKSMTNIIGTDYLYHYTSLEKLALILKNRTIRLSPLDKMDDRQEQKTSDVENVGRFVFVSSWTDDSAESIPMWKMYTDPLAGVRIRMRKNPFKWHTTKGADLEKILHMPANDEASRNASVRTFLDIAKMMDGGYMSPQCWKGEILKEVEYTDDLSLLEPRVSETNGNRMSINLGALGKHKNSYWKFQREWRYIMVFMPMNFKTDVGDMERYAIEMTYKMLNGVQAPPFPFYDLEIADENFEEMEVTCSPQMTPGNRILLESLLKDLNPKARMLDSKLLGNL